MMPASYYHTPESEQDIEEAYAWYEQCQPGVGAEFLSSVGATIASICRSPHLYAVLHDDYRRAMIRRFPYSIYYEYQEGMVTIYGVIHNSRNPQEWRDRLPE